MVRGRSQVRKGRRFRRWAAAVVVAGALAVGLAGLGRLAGPLGPLGPTALGLRRVPVQTVDGASRAESLGLSMGTVVRVTVEGDRADEAIDKVMAELDRLTALFDRFRPFGDLAAINAADGAWVQLA